MTTYESHHGFGLQFCSKCGSTLCGTFDGVVHGVTLGCVNGDPEIEIRMHIFVGSKADAFKLKGTDTKIKDLGGATMLPGFLDPHSHFMSAVMMVDQVNVAAPPVGTSTNIPQIIEKLKGVGAV